MASRSLSFFIKVNKFTPNFYEQEPWKGYPPVDEALLVHNRI
jgi:hypothetical protein